jgi:predicted HicB family RNase H-like nuclease
MEKKQVSFRIEPHIVKRLKFIAVEQDRSLTDLFIEAIKYILNKYEKKTK